MINERKEGNGKKSDPPFPCLGKEKHTATALPTPSFTCLQSHFTPFLLFKLFPDP